MNPNNDRTTFCNDQVSCEHVQPKILIQHIQSYLIEDYHLSHQLEFFIIPKAILISDPYIWLGSEVLGKGEKSSLVIVKCYCKALYPIFGLVLCEEEYLRTDVAICFCLLDPFPLG